MLQVENEWVLAHSILDGKIVSLPYIVILNLNQQLVPDELLDGFYQLILLHSHLDIDGSTQNVNKYD